MPAAAKKTSGKGTTTSPARAASPARSASGGKRKVPAASDRRGLKSKASLVIGQKVVYNRTGESPSFSLMTSPMRFRAALEQVSEGGGSD